MTVFQVPIQTAQRAPQSRRNLQDPTAQGLALCGRVQ